MDLYHLFRSKFKGRGEGGDEVEKPAPIAEGPVGLTGALPKGIPYPAPRWRLDRDAGGHIRRAPAAPILATTDVTLSLDELLPGVPTESVRAGLHDPDRLLVLPVKGLTEALAAGKVTVPLSVLVEACPEVFELLSASGDDPAIPLPVPAIVRRAAEAKAALSVPAEAPVPPVRPPNLEPMPEPAAPAPESRPAAPPPEAAPAPVPPPPEEETRPPIIGIPIRPMIRPPNLSGPFGPVTFAPPPPPPEAKRSEPEPEPRPEPVEESAGTVEPAQPVEEPKAETLSPEPAPEATPEAAAEPPPQHVEPMPMAPMAPETPDAGEIESYAGPAVLDQEPLQAIFMTEEELSLPRIGELSAQLPGVLGCMILIGDYLTQGGERPAGLDATTLRALSQQLAATVVAFQDKLPAEPTFTLYGGSRALSLFTRTDLCLCVVHGSRGFLPGVRERLTAVADALARETALPERPSES